MRYDPGLFLGFINDILLIKNKRRILLFNTANKKEYMLNTDSFLIIEALRNRPAVRELLKTLKRTNILETGKILGFIDFLVKENIISVNNEKDSRLHLIISDTNPPLERIFIELTQKCNQACKHCYMNARYCLKSNNTRELSLYEIKKIIDVSKNAGVWRFDLTGGEIFTRSDIFDILKYLQKRWMVVNIFTNGTLLNEEKAEKLKDFWNITRVILSLDGHTASLHDSFRGIKGGFDKTVHAIKMLERHGFKTFINICLSKQNYTFAQDIIDFIKNNFQSSYMLSPVLNTGRGADYLSDNFVPAETYAEVIKQALRLNHGKIKRACSGFSNYCGVGEEFLFIDCTGDVSICPSLTKREDSKLYIGNFFDCNLEKLWHENETLTDFRNARCKDKNTCSHYDNCLGGCRSRAYLESGDDFCGKDILACSFFGAEKTIEQKV